MTHGIGRFPRDIDRVKNINGRFGMNSREKIQEWSGKRITGDGDEYQIDSVFGEVRYQNTVEGGYSPYGVKITGQWAEPWGTCYSWVEERIEHNAIEITQTCGHSAVLTDETVVGLNEWLSHERTYEEWTRDFQNSCCLQCRRPVPEAEEINLADFGWPGERLIQ